MRLLTALLAACLCASLAQADVPPPPKAANIVTVLSGEKLSGSGVHIGNGIVITAAHVVDGIKALKVGLSDHVKLSATVLLTDKVHDIAVISVKTFDGLEAAHLACRASKGGEEVSAIGHPGGTEFIQTWGRIAGKVRPAGPWQSVIPLDIKIAPGNSGGPLYDAAGEVIGIVVGIQMVPVDPFGNQSVASIAFAVPSTVACEARDYLGLV